MTRAMRWRVGAFTIVGTLALGASFVGCGGDDDDVPSTPDTDSGVDTNTPGGDSGTDTNTPSEAGDTNTPTEGGTDTGTDTPAPVADRQVTMVFAQPDMPATGLFVCLGAFTGDPASATAPIQAIGPAGVPDPAAPTDATKYKGFSYGSVFPFPVTDATAKAALTSLTVVAYFLEANPLTATTPSTCKDAWTGVKTDTNRWFKVDPGTVKAGESHVLALTGCKTPTATNAAWPGICGSDTVDSRNFVEMKLDVSAPTAGATFKTQVMNLTQFAGLVTLPSFQDVDIYLQGMSAAGGGDAGADAADGDASDAPATPTPVGAPVLIGGDTADAKGLSFEDLGAFKNVTLPGDKNSAVFLIVKHGTTPCSGATCLTTVPVPAAPYLAAYAAAGGGFTGQQLIFLLGGGPVPPATTPKVIFGLVPTKLF